jgi:hypothetical protein
MAGAASTATKPHTPKLSVSRAQPALPHCHPFHLLSHIVTNFNCSATTAMPKYNIDFWLKKAASTKNVPSCLEKDPVGTIRAVTVLRSDHRLYLSLLEKNKSSQINVYFPKEDKEDKEDKVLIFYKGDNQYTISHVIGIWGKTLFKPFAEQIQDVINSGVYHWDAPLEVTGNNE